MTWLHKARHGHPPEMPRSHVPAAFQPLQVEAAEAIDVWDAQVFYVGEVWRRHHFDDKGMLFTFPEKIVDRTRWRVSTPLQ